MTSRKPSGAVFVLGLLTGAVSLSLALLFPALARAWDVGGPAPWRGVLLGIQLLGISLALAALFTGFREVSRNVPGRRSKVALDPRTTRRARAASDLEPVPRLVGLSP